MLTQSKSERPLLLLFSDGLETYSWLTGEDVLESAKQIGAVVYVVSAGQLQNNAFLRDLCKATGGSMLEVESTRDLDRVFLGILEEFRRRYLLTYIPKGVSNTGWHTLKVSVRRGRYTIMHRPGYMMEGSGIKRK